MVVMEDQLRELDDRVMTWLSHTNTGVAAGVTTWSVLFAVLFTLAT